jgi:sulfatase maturation enzyme AslB (radical SAM superfamily)
MGVSIDGSEKTHNNFRGSPKSYERAVNAFRVLTAAGIHSEILMTVNRLNVREVEEVFEISGRDPGRFYLKVLHVADSMNEEMRSLCLD